MYQVQKQKGITLIALVITIIVLIILAGVAINLSLGENGIFKRAQQAKKKESESSAREKLELVLVDARIEKEINTNYNSEDYLTGMLEKENITVNGDVVTVDDYSFLISRTELKVIDILGEGFIEENTQIELAVVVTNSSDYGSAIINIEIIFDGNLKNIEINNNSVEIPQKTDGKYLIQREVTENGIYTIIVRDQDDKYKTENINITELTEDMLITSIEELKAFRDKVNIGATFEGKTVALGKDLNLNESKYTVNEDKTITFDSTAEQWIAIGTAETPFKGIFDGNNFTINGIYIDDETKIQQGFFGRNYGTIKNLKVEEGSVIAGHWVGGICGYNSGTIENTINKMNIESKTTTEKQNSCVGGIAGYSEGGIIKNNTNYGNVLGVGGFVGGICGYIENLSEDIINCANLSEYVETTGSNDTHYSHIGGITGYLYNTNITQCYNTANVIGANSNVGGITGQSNGTITKCYNSGTIQSLGVNDLGNNTIGGIVGYSGNTVDSCYNTGDVIATTRLIGGIVGSNGKSNVTIKQELKNCYNIGNVSSGIYSGGVLGIGKSTSNCYYLSGTASYGVGGSTSTTGSNTNATSQTATELKALATTLGSAFISDDEGINDGYPILAWIVEE